MLLSQSIVVICFFVFVILCSSDNDVPIVVYWGQASKNTIQNDLGYYCESDSIDIIVLSFVSVFGQKYLEKYEEESKNGFVLNLSNQCHFNGDYYECPNVGTDIKKCQKLGKKVLLSFGGEEKNSKHPTYGFDNDEEAIEFANLIWDNFGEGDAIDHRPFGDSIIDGFDIDSENQDQTGYLSFIQELSKISKEKGSKQYFFSSAPQCTFPDKNNDKLIDNFELDYIFIQFYNNECGLNTDFNYKEWSNHLLKLGYLKTRLFLGLPSDFTSASNGFIEDTNIIKERINEINLNFVDSSYFGGIMLWDASKGFDPYDRDSNESYIYNIWKNLGGLDSINTTDLDSGSSFTYSDSENNSPITRLRNISNKPTTSTSCIALIIFCLYLVIYNS